MARLSLDSTFGSGGKVTTDFFGSTDEAWAVSVVGNKATVAGRVFNANISSSYRNDFGVARYLLGSLPVADAGGPYSGYEGDFVQLDGSASIANGSGGSFSFVPNDNGSCTVTYTVEDDDGGATSGEVVVTVNNVAPTIAISGVASVNEGSVYTLNLSAADPGDDTITQWTINWGDGSPVETVPGTATTVTHVYADGTRNYTILATATDEDGTYSARAAGANAQASVDPSFGNSGEITHNFQDSTADYVRDTVLIQADGRVVVIGYTQGGNDNIPLARFNSDGTLDTSFGAGGKVVTDSGSYEQGASAVIQSDGKILVGGNFGLARFHADGSLDTAFGNGGRLTNFTGIQKLIPYADGRIPAGSGSRFARFEANGAYDLSFGNVGIANVQSYTDFAVEPTGHIVTVGQTGNYPQNDIVVRRYSSAGVLGSGFATAGTFTFSTSSVDNPNFHDVARKVVIHQGRILVGGYSEDIRANASGQLQGYGRKIVLLRLDSDGVLDAAFDGDGVKYFTYGGSTYDYLYSLAIDAQDQIVVSGASGLYRFAADGTYEAAFNNNAGRTFNSLTSGSEAKPVFDTSGRIYLTGYYYQSTNGEGYNFGVQRFSANGTRDNSFDSDSVVQIDFVGPVADRLRQVVVRQSDGKLIVAGYKQGGTSI